MQHYKKTKITNLPLSIIYLLIFCFMLIFFVFFVFFGKKYLNEHDKEYFDLICITIGIFTTFIFLLCLTGTFKYFTITDEGVVEGQLIFRKKAEFKDVSNYEFKVCTGAGDSIVSENKCIVFYKNKQIIRIPIKYLDKEDIIFLKEIINKYSICETKLK